MATVFLDIEKAFENAGQTGLLYKVERLPILSLAKSSLLAHYFGAENSKFQLEA
jgi:hypothetical protein